VGYCVHEGNGCIYEPGHPTYNAGETEKVAVVDKAYLEDTNRSAAQDVA
jgi:hypothetical protein